MSITYVYGIKCLEVDKYIYVGKSNEPRSRYSKIGNSHNDCVQGFVKEKGEDNFQVEPLETVEFEASSDWIKREGFWIAKFRSEGHPLCNKNDGGGGPTELAEEAKKRLSIVNTGKKYSQEHRDKIRKAQMGHKVSKETRTKIGKANSGKNSYWYGKTGYWYGKQRTEENNQKNREARLEYYKTHENPYAQPYPAFYNEKTEEHIPEGFNLSRMCRKHKLNFPNMYNLKRGHVKHSRSGWRLA